MHGHACEYLINYLKPGNKVLDIGSGSGYLTHVMANLVTGSSPSSTGSSGGQVVGIDHIPELVDLARANMAKSERGRKFLESGQVKFSTADGRLGFKEEAPYDAIHVGAAAKELHDVLIDQLRAPGRMFIPVDTEENETALGSLGLGGGQYIWVVDKKEDGSVHKEKVFQVSYVPLTDAPRRSEVFIRQPREDFATFCTSKSAESLQSKVGIYANRRLVIRDNRRVLSQ